MSGETSPSPPPPTGVAAGRSYPTWVVAAVVIWWVIAAPVWLFFAGLVLWGSGTPAEEPLPYIAFVAFIPIMVMAVYSLIRWVKRGGAALLAWAVLAPVFAIVLALLASAT